VRLPTAPLGHSADKAATLLGIDAAGTSGGAR
jgi:hypothetical protein